MTSNIQMNIIHCCCCSASLSSCNRTASDAKYWTTSALFITMTTSWLEESALAQEFQPDSIRCQILDNQRTFHCNDYFVVGRICTCSGVSSDLMFLSISLNSCLLNLLLVRSHQAEIIIKKCPIKGCNNVIWVWLNQ